MFFFYSYLKDSKAEREDDTAQTPAHHTPIHLTVATSLEGTRVRILDEYPDALCKVASMRVVMVTCFCYLYMVSRPCHCAAGEEEDVKVRGRLL